MENNIMLNYAKFCVVCHSPVSGNRLYGNISKIAYCLISTDSVLSVQHKIRVEWIRTHFQRHRLLRNVEMMFKSVLVNKDFLTSWWHHQMETFSALLAICVWGNHQSQRPVTRSFDVIYFFCARINGWVNNNEGGDLRRHRTIMTSL